MIRAWAKGLTHPLALGVLAASLMLAAASTLGGPWRDRELWLTLWGVLTSLAVASIVAFQRPAAPSEVVETPAVPVAPSSLPTHDLSHLTEEALRHLRAPASLAKCELARRLPASLAMTRAASPSSSASATPLETAQHLRKLIEAAMEKLRLSAEDEPAALQYAVLHSEYVLGLPNVAIMSRHSISESTFHRTRRAGIRALAGELEAMESILTSSAAS